MNTSSSPTTTAITPTPATNPAIATAGVMLACLPSTAPTVVPPAPPTVPLPDPDVDKWVALINSAVRKGVVSFINAGIYLNNAKVVLGHDRWLRMFDSLQIAMSERTAQMLMRIASHQALANANHVSDLPPTLTALYALSGASEETVTGGIKSGDINPEMTASQAKAFVKAQTPSPAPEKPATSFDADARRTRIQQVVQREASKWPDDARTQLADLLEQMAKDIRASVNPTQQP